MGPLDVSYRYFNFRPPLLWFGTASSFKFDMAKLNLLWLVHPEVDTLHERMWDGDGVTESIDKHMDRQTRKMLQGPPMAFAHYWADLCRQSVPEMIASWSDGHLATMAHRAAEAEARLRVEMELPENTVAVDFKRRVKVA